jgi:hypothetical protein
MFLLTSTMISPLKIMYSYFLISFYFLFLELTTMFQITIVIIKIKRKKLLGGWCHNTYFLDLVIVSNERLL